MNDNDHVPRKDRRRETGRWEIYDKKKKQNMGAFV